MYKDLFSVHTVESLALNIQYEQAMDTFPNVASMSFTRAVGSAGMRPQAVMALVALDG